MPVKVSWDNDEQTIIRYETYDRWTMQEFWEAYEEARRMLDSVEHEVDFIMIAMDKISIGHIPDGFISHIRGMYRNAHPRAGRTIIIPRLQGLIGQIWSRIVATSMPQIVERFDYADNLEEARDKLRILQKLRERR